VKALLAFDRYWFAEAKAQRPALLRIATGGFALAYLCVRIPSLVAVARFEDAAFVPTGLVSVLSEPLPESIVTALVLGAIALGVPFVLGAAYRLTAPLFALSFLWVTSYRNSWNMLFHTENLLAVHLVILAFAPAADAYAWDARRVAPAAPSGAYGWPARAMSVVTVVCYGLAGLAKLKLSGPTWLAGDLLRAQIAYDNLRKIELGSWHSPLGAALVHYRAPFVALAVLTIALELGAPLALIGRRTALAWVALAWSFHVGVAAMMAIPFPYQLSLVAYASLFDVEKLWDAVRRRWRRHSSYPPGSSQKA
jgi:hypothetical protein